MKSHTSRWIARLTALALLSASPAFAADPETGKSAPAAPGAEKREQMAGVHQKMAECLRSDRPIGDCKAEMMKGCSGMMEESGCPMMGSTGHGMGMGHGTMGHGKMQSEPTPETPKK